MPNLTRFFGTLGLAIAMATLAPAIFAHTSLTRSVPTADTALDAAPTSVTLEYGDEVKLVRVQLQTPDGDKLTLPLDRSSPPARINELTIPEPISSGNYKVDWSAVGEDGHLMRGEFGFTVK